METQINKQKLLLVDDNELVRIYFREILWLHGLEYHFELEMAESIDQATQIISSSTTCPDIVFLGLVMPVKVGLHTLTTPEAGFNLLRQIKSDPKTKKIKVFIFSAFDKQEYKDKAKLLGAEAYLVKGENLPGDLIAFVQKNLMKKNA